MTIKNYLIGLGLVVITLALEGVLAVLIAMILPPVDAVTGISLAAGLLLVVLLHVWLQQFLEGDTTLRELITPN